MEDRTKAERQRRYIAGLKAAAATASSTVTARVRQLEREVATLGRSLAAAGARIAKLEAELARARSAAWKAKRAANQAAMQAAAKAAHTKPAQIRKPCSKRITEDHAAGRREVATAPPCSVDEADGSAKAGEQS
jgi:hypothetical protein